MNRSEPRRHSGGYYPYESRGHPNNNNNPRPGDRRRDRGGNDRYYYQDRGPPREYRGHYREPYRQEGDYNYGSYSSAAARNRSRSPRSSRSVGSRSDASRSSRSISKSRSRSRSLDRDDDGRERSRSRSKSDRDSRSDRRRTLSNEDRSRRSSRGSYKDDHSRSSRSRTYSSSSNSDSSSSGSSSEDDEQVESHVDESAFTKDQRTVFVSQLVMRTKERDLRKYFRRKVGCKVRDVILLRDKRTGNHKGCAYIEMTDVESVNKAVGVGGQPPDFQRFPILVKASEAEKNYVAPSSSSITTSANTSPYLTKDGRVVEAQKVYVGGLDPINVSEQHLFALFSQFGKLEKVTLQMDPSTNISRGFAFLSFRSPEVANLAIQTMANQVLAGRPMKTGWASQTSSIPGVEIVTSDKFPDDANSRTQQAFAVLAQLTGSPNTIFSTGATSLPSTSSVTSAVDSATNTEVDNSSSNANTTAVPAPASSQTVVGEPSQYILVHNMFDKDEETEEGWEKDLKEEFLEECSKFGNIKSVTVMAKEVGGKIYASFETRESATKCATNLAGRWFDKRQLRVEYVEASNLPDQESEQ